MKFDHQPGPDTCGRRLDAGQDGRLLRYRYTWARRPSPSAPGKRCGFVSRHQKAEHCRASREGFLPDAGRSGAFQSVKAGAHRIVRWLPPLRQSDARDFGYSARRSRSVWGGPEPASTRSTDNAESTPPPGAGTASMGRSGGAGLGGRAISSAGRAHVEQPGFAYRSVRIATGEARG